MKRDWKPPVYSRHSSGQARCRIDGQVRYLGTYGSPESHEAYAQILADWQRSSDRSPRELTVRALAVLFMKFADQYYRTARGKETGEAQNYRDALKLAIAMYGSLPASQLSPLKLKAIRDAMIAAGLARTTINGRIRRLKAVWSWAVSEELVRADVLIGIRTVKGLQRGRTAAREAEPVAPVAEQIVNATLAHLPRQVADAIRVLLLTGARVSEVLKLRPMDIDCSGEVWQAVLAEHKNECRGGVRILFFGPNSQAILQPWIEDRALDAYLFQPREAEDARYQQQAINRKSPMTPSQRKRQQERLRKRSRRRRPAGERYTPESFRKAIERACKAAGIQSWSPGQLRHLRLTNVRKEYGIEAASAVAGHSRLETTQVYTAMSLERARRVMAETG